VNKDSPSEAGIGERTGKMSRYMGTRNVRLAIATFIVAASLGSAAATAVALHVPAPGVHAVSHYAAENPWPSPTSGVPG
jgi:hypothetical protein